MSRATQNKSLDAAKVGKVSLFSVLLLALVARARAEPTSSVVQSSGDSSGEQLAPKRQYFIAPRIGRSMQQQQQARNAQAIWSSLEGASLMAPGQIQPNRGYPGPLRNSLLYLVGANRHLIGQRSAAGLLPQARIGRRASPSGLLPQPRVGRRSMGPADGEFDGVGEQLARELLGGGQQEVPVATISDNAAIDDALESLING